MSYEYFAHNGKILPIKQAVIPVSSVEYAYGFGVYETIRVTRGVPYFLGDHLERLIQSAEIIRLEHVFSENVIADTIAALIEKNNVDTSNVKMLLIGAPTKEDAQLFIVCLNPFYPDKKLYREGATCITYAYERAFPHAKTLNMLQSYLAYKKAKENDAYDALLVDNDGCITEGTRTNFFCIQGKTLISPPEEKILLGVTRKAVLKVAKDNGFAYEERPITWGEMMKYDGAFLTSTSTKIVPIRSADGEELPKSAPALKELMDLYDRFLDSFEGPLH
jgi:branched-chain amino acid aminotransferase